MGELKKQVVTELHKPARKNFPRRRTLIKGLDDLWQADLAEFGLYSRENKGYRFLLVVIDCFSKYLWTAPLKDKTGTSVTNAFKEIFATTLRKPLNLQTDQGKEFYNKGFEVLMKKYNVNHYSTYTIMKASMAERVIRTLKDTLYRTFSLRGNYNWIDVLKEVTMTYNKRKHSTIGMRPCDVTKNSERHLLNTVYSHIKIAGKRSFKVGDIVRISKQKAVFDKGYTPNWSTEMFKIHQVKISSPTAYLLEDMKKDPIKGAFYAEELQLVKYPGVYLVEKVIRRSGDKVLVKWLGFDKSENSWIDKSNIL